MLKTRCFWLFLALAITAVFVVASVPIYGAANSIDNVHWMGNPLPPCFVNAKICGGHVLGTDEVGRDLLVRLVVGIRTSLVVGLLAVVTETALAMAFAFLARRVQPVRSLLVAVSDALSNISPFLFVAVIGAITAWYGEPLVRELRLAVWAGIICWPGMWRLMIGGWRSETIARKAATDWSTFVLMFVAIDLFGFGVQPPVPSLGNMLSNLQANLEIAWWAAVFPAVCAVLVVLPLRIAGRADSVTVRSQT